MYTDQDRTNDFHFFMSNFDSFYNQYGHRFLAIKNGKILGDYASAREAVDSLAPEHEPGTYIVQECSADQDSYIASVMRLQIAGYPA